MLLQIVLDTLVRTSELGLVAMGLSMTWGLTKFANVAHVQYAPVGAYLTLVVCSLFGVGVVIGSVTAIVATGLIAVALQMLFFRRLARFGSATPLIGSLALSIVITALIQTVAGPRPRRLPMPIQPGRMIGGAVVTHAQTIIVITAAVVLVVLFVIHTSTSLGRQVRATAANADLAMASGIDVRRVTDAVTFTAAGLAALGGVFVAMDTSLSLEMGSSMLLAMFAAAIMGGVGSPGGALAASAVLALTEAVVLRVDFGFLVGHTLLVPIDYRPAVGFVAVILVMLFRPTGLFSRRSRSA